MTRPCVRNIARSSLALFLVLTLLSPATADTLDKEIKLGTKAAESIEKRWERVADPAKSARLNMLLARFVPYMERPLPYEVRIIREKTVNAFSLPGGIVYFTTGMLDFMRTDAEIAAILAHELVHADKRHVIIQTARASRISLAAVLLMVATGGAGGPMMLTSLLQAAVTNSYSIDLEREADKEGFRILVEAGFPPSALVTALEAMENDQLRRPHVDMGVFMTHPEMKERVQYILQMAREQNIPIMRKDALHLLRTEVRNAGGRLELAMDGTPLWSVAGTEPNRFLLEGIKEKIDRFFQMETVPYEVEVIVRDGKQGLRIGPSLVVAEPLPEGAESLGRFRAALVDVLNRAKEKHPGVIFMP